MIGWDDGVLCFIEVKTLTKVTLAPPEMAVDAEKKEHIRSGAWRYVRRLWSSCPPPCRFDVISVVLGDDQRGPTIRVHKRAFAWKVALMTGTSRTREPMDNVGDGGRWIEIACFVFLGTFDRRTTHLLVPGSPAKIKGTQP